jgi:hypothetical protein
MITRCNGVRTANGGNIPKNFVTALRLDSDKRGYCARPTGGSWVTQHDARIIDRRGHQPDILELNFLLDVNLGNHDCPIMPGRRALLILGYDLA